MMYKHNEDTLKKAKLQDSGSTSFGFLLLILSLAEFLFAGYTIYEFASSGISHDLLIYVAIHIALITCLSLSAKKFREKLSLGEEISRAETWENEFFLLNCIHIKAMHDIFNPIASEKKRKNNRFYSLWRKRRKIYVSLRTFA